MFQFIRLVLYAFTLPGSHQTLETPIEVDIIQVKKGEPAVEKITEVLNPELAHRRLDRGEICFAAVHKGKIVSYCWFAQGNIGIEEIGMAVSTLPGEVYLYDAFTLSPWRGKGLYPVVLKETLLHAETIGFTRALIFVAENNKASRRGVIKTGFQEFQVVRYFSILGIPFYRYSEPLFDLQPPIFKPL